MIYLEAFRLSPVTAGTTLHSHLNTTGDRAATRGRPYGVIGVKNQKIPARGKKFNFQLSTFNFQLMAAFGFNLALEALILGFAVRHYGTVDDYLHILNFSGAFGEYNFVNAYINVVLSWPLTMLYRLIPHVNWHVWLLAVLYWVSFSAISLALMRRHGTKRGFVFQLLISGVFMPLFLLKFQYTLAAFSASIAGTIMMIGANQSAPALRGQRYAYCYATSIDLSFPIFFETINIFLNGKYL